MAKLRKKAPFWCRAKKPDGQFVHLDRSLREDEGDVCRECAAAAKEVQKRTQAPIARVETLLNPWNQCQPPCPAYYGPNDCLCKEPVSGKPLTPRAYVESAKRVNPALDVSLEGLI